MVNFSIQKGEKCYNTEIYYLFADIYLHIYKIISTFASETRKKESCK